MKIFDFIRNNNYIPLIIFAVSMGFLEAIVVVYIRELYYLDGFQFPLKELPPKIIVVEWIREISTLLMLGSVGWISGKFFLKRFSVFLFIFGIWDIIYYVGLKIFLDWPESMLTWDILFLIPITWVSPVLAPVICSLLMIFMAILLDSGISKNKLNNLKIREYVLLLSGATAIYYTFTEDFGKMIINGNFLGKFTSLAENEEFLALLTTWEPSNYNWPVFILGACLICISLFLIYKRIIAK